MKQSNFTPAVSIIIPAYNAEKTLAKCLAAISAQDYQNIKEIIVVDDGSQDATPEIAKVFNRITYIYQANSGPAAARNAGAAVATGEILFFTDSDCLPRVDWVARMIPHFIRDENAVVAGSYGIANPEILLASCIQEEIFYRHHKLMPDHPRVFGSYNFAIRKSVFKEVGGFNTQYRSASGEDNDLSYKITALGYKIFFERGALVDHFHPKRLWRYLYEQYRHGFWRVKMYQAHPKMRAGDDYTFWKDMVEVPLAFIALILFFISIVFSKFIFILNFLIFIFLFIEVLFACRMLPDWRKRVYFSLVMFLRAFWRTAGFLEGMRVLLSCRKQNKLC
jgi:glycosyltransferase involved in cell wall biosynthesis